MKHRCPICGKTADSSVDADFPFCGERCRLTDLGNWAAEKYEASSAMMDESDSEEAAGGDREPKRRPEDQLEHPDE